MENSSDYNAENITILSGFEAVRMRPAMYLGSLDKRGFRAMIMEFLSENLKPQENQNFIFSFEKNANVSVKLDNPNVEKCLAEILILSGKIKEKKTATLYYHFGFLLIFGLSKKSSVKIGNKFFEFENGVFKNETEIPFISHLELNFQVDNSFFRDFEGFSPENLFHTIAYFETFSYLFPNVKLTILQEYDTPENHQKHIFHHQKGLTNFFEKKQLGMYEMHAQSILDFDKKIKILDFDCHICFGFFAYLYKYEQKRSFVESFANLLPTYEHGSLVDGVLLGIKKFLEYMALSFPRKKKMYEITIPKIKKHVQIAVAIFGEGIKYAGCVKNKLENPEIIPHVENFVFDELCWLMKDKKDKIKALLERF